MALSFAELSATERALAAADKPFLGEIRSLGAYSAGEWVETATGTFAGADLASASFPISRAFDGFPGWVTTPGGAKATLSLLLDFGAAGIEFDAIGLLNHSLFSDGCTDLDITIADDNAFTTPPHVIVSNYNPSTALTADTRVLFDELLHTGATALRYSGVRYVRLGMTFGGAVTPEIGELLFIRRRQLTRTAVRPFREVLQHQRSAQRVFEAHSGVRTKYTRNKGRSVLARDWQIDTSGTDVASIAAWWQHTEEGTQPFVYVEEPNSAPDDFLLCEFPEDEPELDIERIGPFEATFTLEALEVASSFLEQEQ